MTAIWVPIYAVRHDWNKKDARSTLFYGEYGSYGPGAAGREASEQGKRDRGTSRPDWVSMLTRDQIQDYTMERVLGGTDGWNPGAYIVRRKG